MLCQVVHNFRYLWMTYKKLIYFLKLSHGPRFPKIFCDSIKLLGDDSSTKKIANIKKTRLKKTKERNFPRNNKNIWNLMH